MIQPFYWSVADKNNNEYLLRITEQPHYMGFEKVIELHVTVSPAEQENFVLASLTLHFEKTTGEYVANRFTGGILLELLPFIMDALNNTYKKYWGTEIQYLN